MINKFREWRERRHRDKMMVLLFVAIENHISSGGTLDQLFSPVCDNPVLWSQKLQTWMVKIDETDADGDIINVKEGDSIYLANSRGGMREYAKVVKDLGNNVYSLSFDVVDGS